MPYKDPKRRQEYQREYDKTPKRREYLREYMREYNREYHQTLIGKFKHDKHGAKRRGYSWELTTDQVGLIYTQPCHYCGESSNGKLNGIDRQDSSIGYIIENCVSCCTTCNYAKQQMSPEEFIWHCQKVTQFNKK